MGQGRSVLGEQAYRRLRDEIVSGRLAPGELVPEIAVSARLGLSRTPLREAIGRLAEDGLVEVRPNRPARVRPLRKDDAVEVVDLMRTLSMRAHDLAARRISDADLEELRVRTEELAEAVSSPLATVLPDWAEFPDNVVYRAAANGPLLDAIARIRPRVRRLVLLVFPDRFGGLMAEGLRERLAALQSRDRDAAVAAARRQFDRLERAIVDAPLWDASEDEAASG